VTDDDEVRTIRLACARELREAPVPGTDYARRAVWGDQVHDVAVTLERLAAVLTRLEARAPLAERRRAALRSALAQLRLAGAQLEVVIEDERAAWVAAGEPTHDEVVAMYRRLSGEA
jgi:hypothetical protein